MNAVAPRRRWLPALGQEQIVGTVALGLFIGFGVLLDGFLSAANLATLARSVSVLGILAVGMAVVVIGRGLDLSQVAVMVISSAWVLHLMNAGWPTPAALALGLAFALACGAINGVLVAVAEIPPVFTTLAFGILVSGFGRVVLFSETLHHVPQTAPGFVALGQGSLAGVPVPTIAFAVVAWLVHLFLSRTTPGRFVYAQGDNPETTRLTGIKVRPLMVVEYMLCSAIGWLGGVLLAASISSVNLSLINSTLLFDVLMVIVLGGISLVGGRGGIGSVVVGTALIGVLLNGLIVMNVNSDVKDIVKGLVLLAAIVIDVRLHPRDEETARQGDL